MDLKKQRQSKGLTQKYIARKCQIKQGYYSQIERCKMQHIVALEKKLANLLEMDWTEFFN